jgi:hypothetical protein
MNFDNRSKQIWHSEPQTRTTPNATDVVSAPGKTFQVAAIFLPLLGRSPGIAASRVCGFPGGKQPWDT